MEPTKTTRSMVRFTIEGDEVLVPDWVNDLESFRRWTDDDAFPEHGQIAFLRGEVWVDMSKEQPITHTEVKSEINTVLRAIVRAERLGRFFHDGAFLSHETADISNQPDGMFVSTDAVRSPRVQLIEGRGEGLVELEGSPDMVLEVVSRSSVTKDTVILREAYAEAGIAEYWLVNAREQPLVFELLTLHEGRYIPAERHLGWQHSKVFGRWFRLVPIEQAGFASYRLQTQTERP